MVKIQSHFPLMGWLVPENAGIAILTDDVTEDWVTGVVAPGSSMIIAVYEALGEGFAGSGKHRNHWWFAVDSKPGGIAEINCGTSRPISSKFVWR